MYLMVFGLSDAGGVAFTGSAVVDRAGFSREEPMQYGSLRLYMAERPSVPNNSRPSI
jgi:hypothetical protein